MASKFKIGDSVQYTEDDPWTIGGVRMLQTAQRTGTGKVSAIRKTGGTFLYTLTDIVKVGLPNSFHMKLYWESELGAINGN